MGSFLIILTKPEYLPNLLLILCLLMGCQRDREITRYYETSLNAPHELVTVSDYGKQAPVDHPWWDDLESEDLSRWMQQIESTNLGLLQMQARLKAAESRFQVVAANREPGLSAELGGSRRDGSRKSNLSVANSEKWIHSMGLSSSWELDLWGELKANRVAGAHSVAALSQDIQNLKLSLKGQLARAFLQWVGLKEKLNLHDQQIELEQKALKVIESRFSQGQATSLDVLQQRETLASRKRERPLLEKQKQEWQRQMALLLGQHQLESELQQQTLPPWSKQGTEFHIKPLQLFEQRPDLKAQWHRLLESDQLLIAAKAARWPSLNLNFSLQATNGRFANLPQSLFSVISADLMAPILDQGTRKHEVVRRYANQEEQIHRLKELSLNALHEVENAYNGVHYLNQVYRELLLELDWSSKAYQEAQARYLNGQLDYINVLRERNAWFLNQKAQVDLKRDLWKQKIDLYMSMGWNGMSRENQHVK